jgi:RHS repeat-associated protein
VSNWDDFNRLINDVTYPWSGTGVNYEYAYDRYGNRWNQTLNQLCNQGVSVCIKFDQYNHVTGGPLSYDAAGNVINDGNHTYTYDAANHLTGVGGGGTTASYAYDGSGQRVAKTVNGTTVQDLYDLSGHVVTEENAAGQWNRGEVYAGGQHLATYRSDKTYFSAVDALGTERMSATVDQTSNESCMNLPFGDDLTCTGTAVGEVSPLHFTGKERDGESGLDYFIHRHYASTMGRFMQPDPAGMMAVDIGSPQTLNRYTYVLNNPLSLVDPFGLDCAYLNSSGTGERKAGLIRTAVPASAERRADIG